MMPSPIPLGPYDLSGLLATGGMAEVWQGVHRREKLPVAVKIMLGSQTLKTDLRTMVGNEIRAIAGLDHPNIVSVFDCGEVGDDTQEASHGRIAAGAPYLAMELAGRDTLRDACLRFDWPDVKHTLLAILDALAHAHARGVIHLDLKPANVLVCARDRQRPRIKLTDFGIAHIMGPRGEAAATSDNSGLEGPGRVLGTPRYMAPEQFRWCHRDFGPWTDLYALGCLAYVLTSGAPPFCLDDYQALATAHLHCPPPRLQPRIAVPARFDEWLQCLLVKPTSRRFQRAADAAHALRELDEPDAQNPQQQPGDPAPESDGPTRTFGVGLAAAGLKPGPTSRRDPRSITRTRSLPTAAPFGDRSSRKPHLPMDSARSPSPVGASEWPRCPGFRRAPSPPVTWSREPSPDSPPTLPGAGLSLYGLRPPPLEGRVIERDLLWYRLREVHRSGRAQLVLLHGPAGTGKSRLVEWLAERAHELGVATILSASHSPNGEPVDSLARMVAQHLRCCGLTPEQTRERTARLLADQGVRDEYEARALADLIASVGDDLPCSPSAAGLASGGRPIPDAHADSQHQRYALVSRLLARLAAERPVILWLDDVQWSSDALGFAEYLLQYQQIARNPILILMTAQDESLAERTLESGQLEELLRLENTSRLALQPLTPEEHAALLRDLLGLEGDLADRVLERTGGNPLFTVQLVGDWIQRGLLEPRENSFTLKPGTSMILPSDLHQVWAARIGRLLESQPPGAAEALEIASALGQSVAVAEWRVACNAAGVPLPEGLLNTLLNNRLVRIRAHELEGDTLRKSVWSFAHGMLRESLERLARDSGRWAAHNHACAQMILRLYIRPHPHSYSRLGRHYLAAGEWEAALEPLLSAATMHRKGSELRLASRLLMERENAVAALHLGDDDPRVAAGRVLQADVLALQGRVAEAQALSSRFARVAEAHGWTAIQAEAIRILGRLADELGNAAQAATLYQQALTLFEATGDRPQVARCLLGLANCKRLRGDMAEAERCDRAALELSCRLGDLRGQADSYLGMGLTACRRREREEAISLFRMAGDLYRSIGNQLGQAHTLRSLGMVIAEADLEEAEALYQQALAIFERIGHPFGKVRCLNDLAELARRRGDLDVAEAGYRQCLATCSTIAANGDTLVLRLNLAIILLARRRFHDARELLEPCLEELLATDRQVFLGGVHANLLPCAAAARDWGAWDRHYRQSVRYLARSTVLEFDDSWPIQLAGDLALAAGELGRARKAYTFARQLWRALDKTAQVEETSAALRRLHMTQTRQPGRRRAPTQATARL